MAELKNEGIPYRVYRENPAAVPLGWDGEPGAVPDRWTTSSRATSPRPSAGTPRSCRCSPTRLVTRGGPVAAVQLDNEVGMLSWVTNTPELTDAFLEGLAGHLDERSGREAVVERYGADPKDIDAWNAWWRSGGTSGTEDAAARRCTTS